MKPILFFLFSLFLFGSLFSQENHTQQSGVIHYKMKKTFPTDVKFINSKLHFNETETLFVYNKIGMDSLRRGKSMEMSQKEGEISGISVYVPPIDKIGNLTYRNFRDKNIILRFPNSSYVVKDDWLPIKWTIMDEYKEILGYYAQKAIAQFRGRIYIAWFTREIPVPYGPWKLFGLPGLILEAYDTANVAVFKVESICYPCEVLQIDRPNENEEKTIKEYVYIHDYYREMFVVKSNRTALKAGLIGFWTVEQWTNPEDIKKSRQGHFEKIYEWEDYPGDTPSPFEKSLTEIALEYVLKGLERMAADTDIPIGNPFETKDYLKSVPREVRRKYEKQYKTQPVQPLETMPESIRIKAEDGKIDKYPKSVNLKRLEE